MTDYDFTKEYIWWRLPIEPVKVPTRNQLRKMLNKREWKQHLRWLRNFNKKACVS